ncbi:MAG: phospholipase D-like domain-containing protein, partial [Gemmatimonadetes bacterium]|nr:phospholipase D-like domain-containing protein [Gemmatimonadota bacterium]
LCGPLERGIHIALVSTWESIRKVNLQSLHECGPSRLRLFQPAANYETTAVLGSHAKFYIVDEVRIYIGSANLTYLGLNRHLEMGVLLQGEIAQQIYQFWQYLCEIGFFVEIDNQNLS